MKKPLTNNIYCVIVKRCASIYIEADSPKEAMKIAKGWTDNIDEDEFEDSDVEVDGCDSYADEADTDYMDTIYTTDEAIGADEYIDRYETQQAELEGKEAWQRGGWDMTNQLELPLEDEK